jgi:hypothetical protein
MHASALRITARSRASVVLRQSPGASMMTSMARDTAGSWRGLLVRGVIPDSPPRAAGLAHRIRQADHRGSISLPFFESRVGARGQIETARSALPPLHLRDADFDAALARAGIPGCIHPPNPLPARRRRDVLPQLLDPVWRRSEGALKITWHLWPPVVDRRGRGLRSRVCLARPRPCLPT